VKVLILGGTSFVGRHIDEIARSHGHEVTLLNRGVSPNDSPAEVLIADRDDPAALSVLEGRSWDVAIDVSGLNAARVLTAARALRDAVDHYVLVSTVSVYDPAPGAFVTEDSPTVAADPDDPSGPEMSRYAEQKRAAELAALRTFGAEQVAVLRPGVILGPFENIGRLSYWLGRAATPGQFIAPGQPSRAFDFVDARDLAEFAVHLGRQRTSGVFTCLNPAGRDTWGDFIASACWATGAEAEPVWVPDEVLLEAGVAQWSGLPMWLAAEPAVYSTQAATAAGLECRPMSVTLEDSWSWLAGLEAEPPRLYRPAALDRETEARILAAYAARS
jgi:2'-hydroxyisoflavone reductase